MAADVRVLAAVEAAVFLIRHESGEVGLNPGRDFPVLVVAGDLVCFQVIVQQARLHIEHLLVMRLGPVRLCRVPVEAAPYGVIYPHRAFQCLRGNPQHVLIAGLTVSQECKAHGIGIRELRLCGEASVLRIEFSPERSLDGLYNARVECQSGRLSFHSVRFCLRCHARDVHGD